MLQYYADEGPQDDPDDFDANRAALGLRTRPRKVHSLIAVLHLIGTLQCMHTTYFSYMHRYTV